MTTITSLKLDKARAEAARMNDLYGPPATEALDALDFPTEALPLVEPAVQIDAPYVEPSMPWLGAAMILALVVASMFGFWLMAGEPSIAGRWKDVVLLALLGNSPFVTMHLLNRRNAR
jgi:hypothetical protein